MNSTANKGGNEMKRMITAAAAAAGSLALLGWWPGAPALAGSPTNQAWGPTPPARSR